MSAPLRGALGIPYLLLVLAMVFTMVFTMVFGHNVVAAPGAHGVPVKVVAAKRMLMAPQTWVAGTVVSRHEARLSAEVAGKLVLVKAVGTRVKEGGVVAKIDPSFAKLKVEEFAAQVESHRARLQFLRNEVDRNRRQVIQNNAAHIHWDEVRADREAARNELRASRLRLEQAREVLRHHVIRSPFAGVVAEQLMHRGESAAVNDDVVRVVDSHDLEVQARVPLNTLDFVHEGEPLTLSINDKEISALVRSLAAVTDGASRLLDLRIKLENGAWTIGQTVRVALPTAPAKIVLAVPRDALVSRGDDTFVFRVADKNTAQRVAVKPGVASGEWVAVSGGLNAGDRVVVSGGERLRPGSEVRILSGSE